MFAKPSGEKPARPLDYCSHRLKVLVEACLPCRELVGKEPGCSALRAAVGALWADPGPAEPCDRCGFPLGKVTNLLVRCPRLASGQE